MVLLPVKLKTEVRLLRIGFWNLETIETCWLVQFWCNSLFYNVQKNLRFLFFNIEFLLPGSSLWTPIPQFYSDPTWGQKSLRPDDSSSNCTSHRLFFLGGVHICLVSLKIEQVILAGSWTSSTPVFQVKVLPWSKGLCPSKPNPFHCDNIFWAIRW